MNDLGIVVGEVSGDNLASSAVRVLKEQNPLLSVAGICGPNLIKAGAKALYPMEKLAVMGLIEPLLKIPEILSIRRNIKQYFLQNRPKVFMGVDSSTFNLSLELSLKQHGIKTIHYGCPTVWAWRKGRIKTLQKGVDLMLVLFPFEAEFLKQYDIPVKLTGHPLFDEIPIVIDTESAKTKLNLEKDKLVVALLPGSRNNELKYLGEIALRTALALHHERKDLQFTMPLVSLAHREYMEKLLAKLESENNRKKDNDRKQKAFENNQNDRKQIAFENNQKMKIHFFVGNTRTVMEASDVALVTSGTATLELMLCKKPMVVMYRMNPLTFQIAKRIITTDFIALPNMLAKERLVPEFIQSEATVNHLSKALLEWIEDKNRVQMLKERFTALHRELRLGAALKAAEAISSLMG